MPKNPKHRPPNERRIKSMLRHYLAAFETFVIRGDDECSAESLFKELYGGGKEFPYDCSDQETVNDWYEMRTNVYGPLSNKPRGDKMLVYRIAAKTFNNQLAIDRAGNKLLGIEPSRLDEKEITPGAIQKQISRINQGKPETLQKILDDWKWTLSSMEKELNEDS